MRLASAWTLCTLKKEFTGGFFEYWTRLTCVSSSTTSNLNDPIMNFMKISLIHQWFITGLNIIRRFFLRLRVPNRHNKYHITFAHHLDSVRTSFALNHIKHVRMFYEFSNLILHSYIYVIVIILHVHPHDIIYIATHKLPHIMYILHNFSWEIDS